MLSLVKLPLIDDGLDCVTCLTCGLNKLGIDRIDQTGTKTEMLTGPCVAFPVSVLKGKKINFSA